MSNNLSFTFSFHFFDIQFIAAWNTLAKDMIRNSFRVWGLFGLCDNVDKDMLRKCSVCEHYSE